MEPSFQTDRDGIVDLNPGSTQYFNGIIFAIQELYGWILFYVGPGEAEAYRDIITKYGWLQISADAVERHVAETRLFEQCPYLFSHQVLMQMIKDRASALGLPVIMDNALASTHESQNNNGREALDAAFYQIVNDGRYNQMAPEYNQSIGTEFSAAGQGLLGLNTEATLGMKNNTLNFNEDYTGFLSQGSMDQDPQVQGSMAQESMPQGFMPQGSMAQNVLPHQGIPAHATTGQGTDGVKALSNHVPFTMNPILSDGVGFFGPKLRVDRPLKIEASAEDIAIYLKKLADYLRTARDLPAEFRIISNLNLLNGYTLYRHGKDLRFQYHLYGHPSGRQFLSGHKFSKHFIHLMQNLGSNFRCPCDLCVWMSKNGNKLPLRPRD